MKRSIAVTIVVGLLVGSFVFLTTRKRQDGRADQDRGCLQHYRLGRFHRQLVKDALMAIVEDVNKKGGILGDRSSCTWRMTKATRQMRSLPPQS